MLVAGVNLSKANAEKIATEALRIAAEEGYCDEAKNIVERLGLPIPTRTAVVTITAEVELEWDEDEPSTDHYDYSLTSNWNTLDVTKVEVKTVKA